MFGMATITLGIGPHSSFVLFLFFFFFFLAYSQRSQTGCLPFFYTWCGPSANLECRSEMWCTRLAGNAGPKKIAICAPSHNFVGPYLRNYGTYLQSKKNAAHRRPTKLCTMFGRLLGWYIHFRGLGGHHVGHRSPS